MTKVAVTKQYLQDIGNSIRIKNGLSTTYKPSQMATAIVNIPMDGDHSAEDAIIDKTISGSYTNSRVTSVAPSTFCECSSLTAVHFSACASIGSYAFENCINLTEADFDICTNINSCAFSNCYSLTNVSFPSCSSIGNLAFNNCANLTAASFPTCQTIGASAFNNCTSLSTASFPACTTIGSSAFYKCHIFISLYLPGSSIVNLAASNAFGSTPFMGYVSSTSGVYGSIYVPASLIESYKTATNWIYYSMRFVSI